MGDEMDTMIPEREMKVSYLPGPPFLPPFLWRPAERGSAGAGCPASRLNDWGIQSSHPSIPERSAVMPAQ